MRKIIDLECDLPPDENGNPRKLEAATHPPGYGDPEWLPPLEGHGFPADACAEEASTLKAVIAILNSGRRNVDQATYEGAVAEPT
jgi:hypothetical protein